MKEAKRRAESLRDEAKQLLKDAQSKLQRLAGAYPLHLSVCVWFALAKKTQMHIHDQRRCERTSNAGNCLEY